jgi:hypothetical protein
MQATLAPAGASPNMIPLVLGMSPKHAGAYYTPDTVAASLVRWAGRTGAATMLDPACGDGRFIR